MGRNPPADAKEPTRERRDCHSGGDYPAHSTRGGHGLTAEENRRLGALLVDIKPDQWSLPTDCTRWDVRAIVVHLIATAEAQASAIEFVPQAVVGSRLTKQIGGIYPVDGLNEVGLRARRHLELSRRERAACPASHAQTDPGAAAPQARTEILEAARLPLRHRLHP